MKISPVYLSTYLIAALMWTSVVVAQNDRKPMDSNQENDGSAVVDSTEWIKMAPTGAWATFEVPARPRYVERSFKPVIGREAIKVKLHIARSEDGLRSYVFSYHDMLELPADQKTIDSALEGAMRGSLATVNGALMAVPEEVIYQRARGRQFAYKFQQNGKEFRVISRIFLLKQRQFQLSVIMPEEKLARESAQYFFDSFRIVLPEPDLPPVPRFNR